MPSRSGCHIYTLWHFAVKHQEESRIFIILGALLKTEQSQRCSPWTSPSAHSEAAELMQEDCKTQPHILMPTADQHSLKRVVAFPSNLFPLHFKCKLGSNVVLNPKAHSEDLRLHSSGSTQCLQSTEAQQSLYGFCRWSICSILYLKRPSGRWSVPNHQPAPLNDRLCAPSHKSQTEKQQCKLLEQCLQLRSNFHTYLLLPTTTFCKFQHSRLPGDGQSWDLTSGASTSHTCFGPGEDSHKLDGNSRSEEQEKAAGMEQMNFKQVQKPEMGITQVPHK